MPNWVTTSIITDKETYKKIKKDLVTEDSFDFKKLIPMPAGIESISNSPDMELAYKLVCYYLSEIGKNSISKNAFTKDIFLEDIFSGPFDPDEKTWLKKDDNGDYVLAEELLDKFSKDIQLFISSSRDEEIPCKDVFNYSIGKILYENAKLYGYYDWYLWSYDHWGTKWNARHNEFDDDNFQICFDTAWSEPLPIYFKLSEKYPDSEFNIYICYEMGELPDSEITLKNGHWDELTDDRGSVRVRTECYGLEKTAEHRNELYGKIAFATHLD